MEIKIEQIENILSILEDHEGDPGGYLFVDAPTGLLYKESLYRHFKFLKELLEKELYDFRNKVPDKGGELYDFRNKVPDEGELKEFKNKNEERRDLDIDPWIDLLDLSPNCKVTLKLCDYSSKIDFIIRTITQFNPDNETDVAMIFDLMDGLYMYNFKKYTTITKNELIKELCIYDDFQLDYLIKIIKLDLIRREKSRHFHLDKIADENEEEIFNLEEETENDKILNEITRLMEERKTAPGGSSVQSLSINFNSLKFT